VFAAFSGLVFAAAGQPAQRAWAACAAVGYALAACITWRLRGRYRRAVALSVALAGAVAAPLAWQVTGGRTAAGPDQGTLAVVTRAAVLLVHHGTPYLPAGQISGTLGYNPYEPATAVFGLPAAAGVPGAAGNPRLWMILTTAAVLLAAFRLAAPGKAPECTAFALGSPVLALPLTAGLTDPPVIALLSLTLACAARGASPRARLAAALALGAACAMKATAWPALPVVAAMLTARDGPRAAARFVLGTAAATGLLSLAMTPASLTAPAALFQNTVLFPLGLTRVQTPAASPLPGHLLAETGPAGRWAAIAVLGVACLAAAMALAIRPPAGSAAAACWLSVEFTGLFAVAPASRWGYFAYPAALLGFAGLTSGQRCSRNALRSLMPGFAAAGRARADQVPRLAGQPIRALDSP
jgi:hypothetical protein